MTTLVHTEYSSWEVDAPGRRIRYVGLNTPLPMGYARSLASVIGEDGLLKPKACVVRLAEPDGWTPYASVRMEVGRPFVVVWRSGTELPMALSPVTGIEETS